jgi:hypothetical protein
MMSSQHLISTTNATTKMSSSSSSSGIVLGTYEATKAAACVSEQPDPIHWHDSAAFRDSSYRQLHHQRGVVGIFSVRLLQAEDLQRSHWSPFALGPVKHLGLSKAHGAVSSFCTFTLDFASGRGDSADDRTVRSGARQLDDMSDRKPAAVKRPGNSKNKPSFVSPVIPESNSPVWDSCAFEFPLKKGVCPDGSRVLLCVAVEEEATAVENFFPGVTPSNRQLGTGQLDLTELCLGETGKGLALPGVLDTWIDLTLEQDGSGEMIPDLTKEDPLAPPVKLEAATKPTGRVRVLVSYQPCGLEPQPKDVVALEAFARCNTKIASCRPVLDPLMPLTIVDRRGSYLLASYFLPDGRKACVRLHRNAVFVIERQNIIDAATNLALLPVDVALSTPVGQAVTHALTPLVAAGSELLMPAMLSAKLVWMAVRTTGLGVASGLLALTGTVWHEGSSSLTRGSHLNRPNGHGASHAVNVDPAVAKRASGTAQFVQL